MINTLLKNIQNKTYNENLPDIDVVQISIDDRNILDVLFKCSFLNKVSDPT